MVRQDAIATGQSGDAFVPKATDAELDQHMNKVMGEMPGYLLHYQHLTPNRTRVTIQAPFDLELHHQAIEVALSDSAELAAREAARHAGSTEP
jgi:hypothetical protein